jgi:NACHT domain
MPDTSPTPGSDPQIRQDVKGSQNQTIGQVLGGVVVNNLTIYERVSEALLPPPIRVEQPLTQQEYRQRQVLLNKVRDYWVKGVLETSLHAKMLIALGLQERLDLVQRPFSGVAEFSDAPGQALPEGTQATNVFVEMGEGRTLLILGEPGAGKTIALLKLAEDLIVRTEPDLRQSIPVVFNLSSWARKPQTIEQWLVQELLEKYQVSKALGKAWVETEAMILLLDGLDEVKAEQRNACVQALEDV